MYSIAAKGAKDAHAAVSKKFTEADISLILRRYLRFCSLMNSRPMSGSISVDRHPRPCFLALQWLQQKTDACGPVFLAQSIDRLRYSCKWLVAFAYIPRKTRNFEHYNTPHSVRDSCAAFQSDLP
jgi:hypothetical protein